MALVGESGITGEPPYSLFPDGYANCTPSNMTEAELEAQKFEQIFAIVAPVLFSICTVIGIVGNILVITVVVSNNQMRNTTNLLITNLAIADLSFIIMCVPFTATIYAVASWPFGITWCKIYQYTIYVTCYVSVYTLVLMSLDRYLAVVHPITSMSIRNSKNAVTLTLLTWFIICVANVPILFKFTEVGYELPPSCVYRTACIDPDIRNPVNARAFFGSLFVFAFLLPLTLVTVLYGLMLKRLLYGVAPRGSQSSESQRSKRRVTRLVVIVVVVFAVCWLPLQIMFMIQHFGPDPENLSPLFIGIRIASHCLAYMNSCVNPILYAFLSDNFRKSFIKLLCNKTIATNRFEFERTNVKGIETSKSTGVTDTNCV